MVELPDGEKSVRIYLAVPTQHRRVIDRQTFSTALYELVCSMVTEITGDNFPGDNPLPKIPPPRK